MKSEKRGKPSGEEEHLVKTFDLFLNDLLYLKDLKTYIDDEIFKSLIKYHFESGPMTTPPSTAQSSKTQAFLTKMEDEDSGNGSQAETDDCRSTRRELESKQTKVASPDEIEYRNTVDELKSILSKWEALLTHEVLDLNKFDPDSYYELMKFSNYSAFEPILRLVPDLFAKCYKCIDLAKTWLKLSNIVLGHLPLENVDDNGESVDFQTVSEGNTPTDGMEQPDDEFWDQVKNIKGQIVSVTASIADDEELLQKYT